MQQKTREQMVAAILGPSGLGSPDWLRKELELFATQDLDAIEKIFDDAIRESAGIIFLTGIALVLGMILKVTDEEPDGVFMLAQKVMVASVVNRLMSSGIKFDVLFDDKGASNQ